MNNGEAWQIKAAIGRLQSSWRITGMPHGKKQQGRKIMGIFRLISRITNHRLF
ncbi:MULTISPECIES: hypothetical protein [Photorhabdus]|uniref:hypothetical protein n=1 Tax=Photorhabdus TaxID=29487 RepID=UPI00030B53CB|nr:hypothetical protein [Photorhabdus asymbiotica]